MDGIMEKIGQGTGVKGSEGKKEQVFSWRASLALAVLGIVFLGFQNYIEINYKHDLVAPFIFIAKGVVGLKIGYDLIKWAVSNIWKDFVRPMKDLKEQNSAIHANTAEISTKVDEQAALNDQQNEALRHQTSFLEELTGRVTHLSGDVKFLISKGNHLIIFRQVLETDVKKREVMFEQHPSAKQFLGLAMSDFYSFCSDVYKTFYSFDSTGRKTRAITIENFSQRLSSSSVDTTRKAVELLGSECMNNFVDKQRHNVDEYISDLKRIMDDDENSEAERFLDISNRFFERGIDNLCRVLPIEEPEGELNDAIKHKNDSEGAFHRLIPDR